jgi:hypothetical protein
MAKTCQHCGSTTDNDARVMCPTCGRRMQPAGAVPPEALPPTEALPPAAAAAPAANPYAPRFGEPDSPSYGVVADPSWAAGYVNVEPPRPQLYVSRRTQSRTSRLTVAFRLVLAIPHLVVWFVASEVVSLIVIIAWFAAVFTARVPYNLYEIIGWYVDYSARLFAYVTLLTDRWPTFGAMSENPATIWLPGPQRLNRAAVFFRYFLAFPASALASLITFGLAIASPLIWLIVLVAGRVPRPVFNATASVLRYQMRQYAYLYLLTAAYPGGLFGDPADRREDDDLPAPTEASAEPVPPPDVPRPPVLHRTARRLVTVFIVLGCLGFVGNFAATALLAGDTIDRFRANGDLVQAYEAIDAPDISACSTAADRFACLKEDARQDAEAFSEFAAAVRAIDFPTDVRSQVATLLAATDTFVADFRSLSNSPDLQAFNAFVRIHDMQAEGQAVDDAEQALNEALVLGR